MLRVKNFNGLKNEIIKRANKRKWVVTYNPYDEDIIYIQIPNVSENRAIVIFDYRNKAINVYNKRLSFNLYDKFNTKTDVILAIERFVTNSKSIELFNSRFY